MSKLTKQIELAIGACEREMRELRRSLVEAYGNCYLHCMHCGKRSQIKTADMIDVQWYDSNTGSPNGGYYRHSHYAWRCPKCEEFRLNPVPVVGKEIKIPFESFKSHKEVHQK